MSARVHHNPPTAGRGVPVRARVPHPSAIGVVLERWGLGPCPVVVVVGGAGGAGDDSVAMLCDLFRAVLLPAVERSGAAVVDGGTDAGVMRALGRARTVDDHRFPLVGVAAEGTLAGGDGTGPDVAEPEPNHTHLVLVPGVAWGDESPWLDEVAHRLAGASPSLTVVVNGGEITYADVAHSLVRRRPVLVLAGTGRTADAVAGARAGREADPRARAIAASPLTQIAAVDDPDDVARRLGDALEDWS